MSIQAKRNALFGLAVLVALGLLVFVIETAQVNAQGYVVEGSREPGVRSGAALAQSSSLSLFWEEDFAAPISSTTYYTTATSGSGVVSDTSFLLTRNAGSQRGRIFYLTPTLMSEFSATFRLYLGDNEGGGDGVAFIFCPSYDYSPGVGGSLDASCPGGYLVAFDTWDPGPLVPDQVYVAFESTDPLDRLAVSDVPQLQLEDGAWHTAGVDFRGGAITVTLDGSDVITGATLPGYSPFIGYFGFSGATGGATNEQRVDEIQVVALLPDGVFLTPVSASGSGSIDSTVIYTETLHNLTGITDTFDLALSGNVWSTTLSITNTGALTDGTSISFTVQVTIPTWASLGNSDDVTVIATSVTSPTVYSDTATLTTRIPRDCNDPHNPIVNCGFETGDFSGWVTKDMADPFFFLRVGEAGTSPGFPLFTSEPTEGSYAALHGFDGGGPDSIQIAQDVTLPAGATTLVFNYRAGWEMSSEGATLDRYFQVRIEPAGGGIPLQTTTLLTATAGTDVYDTGNLTGTVGLIPFAGSAVRINFYWWVPESFTGPAFFQLDNVLVERSPLVLAKAADPTLLDPGDPLTYTLTFSNSHATITATDVVITDIIPIYLDNPSIVGNSGATITPTAGITYAWRVEDLSPGERGVITITGILGTGLLPGQTFVNTVSASAVFNDALRTYWASAAVSRHGADLAVSKTVNDPMPYAGQVITYTLSVVNHGPSSAAGIVISDALPLGVTYVSSDTTQGTYIPLSGLWALGALPVNHSALLTLTVQVDPGLAGGTLVTNTAVVSASSRLDPDTDNDADSAVFEVAHADLAVGKVDAPDPVVAGERLTYTLTVTNHGPSIASGSTWADTLTNPSIITIPDPGFGTEGPAIPYPSTIPVSGLPGGIIKATVTLSNVNHTYPWDMDVLLVGPGGQSVLLMSDAGSYFALNNVRLTFDDDAPGPLPYDAQITSGDYQPTNHVGNADTFSAPAPPGPYGATLSVFDGINPNGTWSLYVMDNAGGDSGSIAGGWSLSLVTGDSGTLTDVLPGGVTFLSASPGCHDTGGSVITCTVGGLPVGATTEITIAVTAPGTGGPITNTVSVAGVLDDLEPSNDTDSESTWVSAEADLAVDKRDWPDPVLAGDWLTYTFVITNNGPDWAIGVVLTDALPAGVSYDLALLLRLDEAAGATHFEDGSGRGNHGTCSGDACPTAGVSGRYGQAAQFDGVDDYVSLPDLPSYDELTVGMWVKIPGLPSSLRSLIHHDGWSFGDVHLHLWPDGRLGFGLNGNVPGDRYSTFAFDDATFNQWTHLAYVYDTEQKQVSFYVNGVLDVVRSLTTANVGDLGPGQIGNWDSGPRAFEGEMDEIVVYSRALTAVEVAALYQDGFSDPTPAASQGTCAIDGGLTCDLGVMPPGAVATVTLRVRVNSALTGSITNTAYVSGYVPDPVSGNDDDDESTLVETQADLGVGKWVDPDPGLMGSPITYTVTISNSGPSDARGVLLTDTLQGAVTWGAITPSQGSCGAESGGTFTCTLGTIGAAHRAQVTLVVTPSAAGRLTNTVRVTGDEFDPLTGNDVFTHTVDIGEIDLALTKSADPTYLPEGDDVAYILLLVNNGPVPASGVVVSETLPSAISVTGSDASHGSYAGGVWDVGGLAVGEVARLTITGTVGAGTAAQVLVNTAVLSASTPLDIITGNNAASADVQVAGADLALSKSVNDDEPDEGDTVVYELQVTNLGPDDTTGVVVSDTLPLGVTFVSSSTTQGSYDESSGAWTAGALNVDDSATLHITATVDADTAGDTIINRAAISASDQPDSLTANNAADATITVSSGGDIYLPLVLRDY